MKTYCFDKVVVITHNLHYEVNKIMSDFDGIVKDVISLVALLSTQKPMISMSYNGVLRVWSMKTYTIITHRMTS